MNKVIYLLSVLLILNSCGSKKKVAATTSETPAPAVSTTASTPKSDGLEDFLKRFELAATTHNKTELLALMDKDYKMQQHDVFYKGNTELFLNSFFCNYQTNGQGFKCISYDKISEAERVEVLENDGNFTGVYRITGDKITIKCDWLIMVRKEGNTKIYGFFGPQG